MPSDQQFRIALQSRIAVGITASVLRVIPQKSGLFLHINESPNLVSLNISNRDTANRCFQEPFALLAVVYHKVKNGPLGNSSQTLHGSDAVAFHEHSQTENRLLFGDETAITWASLLRGERATASITSRTLTAVAVETE
jgi:hypothetical protein